MDEVVLVCNDCDCEWVGAEYGDACPICGSYNVRRVAVTFYVDGYHFYPDPNLYPTPEESEGEA